MFGKKKRKEKKAEQREGQEVLSGYVEHKKTGLARHRFRKFVVFLCWVLFLGAFAWSVYRNYTVVDRVTKVEKETIKETIVDTTGIENFVKNFVVVYDTYSPDTEVQAGRLQMLEGYLGEEQLRLLPENSGTKAVSVSNVQIWGVKKKGEAGKYQVSYTVSRKMDSAVSTGSYCVEVYADGEDCVVTKLPYPVAAPKKAAYEVKEEAQAELVSAKVQSAVEEFLNTFFKAYPTATAEELKYYYKEGQAEEIARDVTFVSVDQTVITEVDGEQVKVSCAVTYQDNGTGLKETSQYRLTLERAEAGNYVIARME